MRKIRLNNFVDLKDKTVSSHKLRIQEMEKEWYEYTRPLTFCEDIVCSGIPKLRCSETARMHAECQRVYTPDHQQQQPSNYICATLKTL